MTAGVTSSLFVGALAILCAAYFCYKVGLTKVLRCCCSCLHQGGGQGAIEQHQLQNFPVMTPQTMQQPVQQPQSVMPSVGVGQFGMLDLPKGLTFKMVQKCKMEEGRIKMEEGTEDGRMKILYS